MTAVFLAVIFSFLAFPNVFLHFGYWPLAWAGLIFFFAALEDQKPAARVMAGFIFGLLFYGLILFWFVSYSFIGYFLFVAGLSLQPAFFALLYGLKPSGRGREVLFVAAAWVATEFLRSLFLAGFSWDLAVSQGFQPLAIQIAALTGSGGLSFVLAAVNFCLYRYFKGRKRDIYYPAIALAFVFLVFGYGWWVMRFEARGQAGFGAIRVLAVQPDVDLKDKQDEEALDKIVERLTTLTEKGLQGSPVDLVAWPETAVPLDFRKEPDLLIRLKDLAEKINGNFLFGAALREGDKDFNSAVLMDARGRIKHVYHKRRLVPFSEYCPRGRLWWDLRKRAIVRTYDFSPGDKPGVMPLEIAAGNTGDSFQKYFLGVLICSEDTIGALFREYQAREVGIVVVLLNDGWFRHPQALIMHAQNAVLHAVENRRPVLRVANTGWTVAIDAFGRVMAGGRVPFNRAEVARFAVRPGKAKTAAYFIGDSFCLLCLGFVIITLFPQRKKFHDA